MSNVSRLTSMLESMRTLDDRLATIESSVLGLGALGQPGSIRLCRARAYMRGAIGEMSNALGHQLDPIAGAGS